MLKRRHRILALVALAALAHSAAIEAVHAQEPPRWRPSRPAANRADYSEDPAPQDSYSQDQFYYNGPISQRTGRPPRQYLQSRAGTIATTSSIEGPSFARDPYDQMYRTSNEQAYRQPQYQAYRQPPHQQGYRQQQYHEAYGQPQYEQAYRQPNARGANWQPEPQAEIIEPNQSGAYYSGGGYNGAPIPSGPYVPPPAYNPAMAGPTTGAYYPGGGYDYNGGGYGGGYDGYGAGDCGDCGGGGCGSCGPCGPCGPCGGCGFTAPCSGPWYARGEYLLWWFSGDSQPPMVTTSPTGTAPLQAGVLGQPGTSLLYGNNTVNTSGRSGVRVTLGKWLDPSTRIEGEWFDLGNVSTGFSDASNGTPILARPFFNLQTGAQGSNLIAYPNRSSGSININNSSNFLGAGIQASKNMLCGAAWGGDQYRVDFLYGFRYLGLYEGLTTDSRLTTGPASPFPAGSVFASSDRFSTSNSFFGGNIGMITEARAARWCFTGIGRLGIGGTVENVAINGSSTAISPAGAVTHSAGGFYAQPTNIGNYNRGAFAVVPHLELKIGYDFTPAWRATFGYDVLYWSRVVRPGQQLDEFINPSQSGGGALTGTPGPLFRFVETDLWVQGISAGLEYRF